MEFDEMFEIARRERDELNLAVDKILRSNGARMRDPKDPAIIIAETENETRGYLLA